jgi:hypothetical protein
MAAEGRVAGEVVDSARRLDHISAPQSPVAVEESSRRKMHGRHAVNEGCAERPRFAPIEFVDRADVLRSQQPGYSGRNNELRLSASGEPAQAGKVEMIVMIVTEEHGIDAGQVLPPHARHPAAARTDGGEWTGALAPDGIGQDVKTALLEEHCGVVDQGNVEPAAFDAGRRFRLAHVRNETGRRLGAGGELPSQEIEKAAGRGAAGIEEALPVEVDRKWW